MKDQKEMKNIAKVVVLGDIGRSPRMQYHALSLANNGLQVNIIGYFDSAPLKEIQENANITITKLYPVVFNKGPKIIQYCIKALWQMISLLVALFISGKCNYLLCQNPPAIPTLPICRFYCLITKTKFIVDWHNYAHTIMALSLSPNSYLLKISSKIEKYFGQGSDHNLCVTYGMKDDLLVNWKINASVLYDRPPKIFHPITLEEKHDWFLKISQQFPEFGCLGREQLNQSTSVTNTRTAFTQMFHDHIELRPDRPGLLFSSTSWTPDEDFGILMEALQAYETTYDVSKKLPKLICVITGKGPMKQYYIEQIGLKKWQHVRVITPWLEAADYPTMVASADLGVCLHTSSSGLDLPMKVVDMFGAGLPVCAYQFKCLHELVEDSVNGYIFKDSNELSKHIISWFDEFPNNCERNQAEIRIKKELRKFQESRWEENWNLRAKKYFM